jgi:hypothetical protein
MHMPDNSRFFFVGSGRSGSTLLRLLLMGHSRIHIPPETWFIIPLVERLPLHEPLSAAQVREAVEIITNDYRWQDMGIAATDLKSSAVGLHQPHLRDIIDLIYNDLLRPLGKARLGDKTPPYIAIVPQLASLYPEAKFIHLIRDGRDVAISFVQLGFAQRCHDGRRFEWIAAMRAAHNYRSTHYADRILEVRYEELVRHPQSTLRQICAFLGEEFEPQMVNRPLQIDAVPERERHIHAGLDQPVSPDGVAIWRRKLSAFQCFCMESCLRQYLVEFGYELRFARTIWQPLLIVTGLALRFASPLLDRAVPPLRRRNLLAENFYL